MARASGTAWTNTETTDFEAGDLLRVDKLLTQVLQNLEWFAQSHAHDGVAGSGGPVGMSKAKIRFFGGDF